LERKSLPRFIWGKDEGEEIKALGGYAGT